jgi:putative ABC transport system permease protein
MHPEGPSLPSWVERSLKHFYDGEELQEKLGDFEEIYWGKIGKSGKTRRTLWCLIQIIRMVVSSLELSFYWSFGMFKNYVMIAWRNLRRQKVYSLITVSGLALGIAAFLLIAVWVLHELSFDRFHENASSIFQVFEKRHFPDQVRHSFRTPGPLSEQLKEHFPEIRESARVAMTGERVMRCSDKIFYEDQIITVDPEFFSMFSFPFIEGDKETALRSPDSMVISERFVRKYFGRENPIGKVITMDNRLDFRVTGVIKNVPANSHLKFDMVVPFEVVEKLGWKTDAWDFSMALTYILLQKSTDYRSFEQKIASFVKNYDKETNRELFLKPLTRIHLYSNYDNPESQGRIQYVYVFALVGSLILIIACINFMNLATARSEYRSKEIGMRKVIGAGKTQIVRQFLMEAVFIALLSLLLAPLLIKLVLPGFNEVTGETFTLASFANLRMILLILGVTLMTGILSGSYPALFLSSIQPVKVFYRHIQPGFKSSLMRKVLVLFQMSISLVLLIISVIIFSQIDYLKNKDLGFDKEHVISLPLGISNKENSNVYKRFKNEIKKIPQIESVSAAFTHPTRLGTQAKDVIFEGRRLDDEMPINITSVDFDFIETLKIKVLKGRSFSEDYGTEGGNLIINERFEKILGDESALNKTLSIGDTYSGNIIGVVQDFHIESVSNAYIGPLILFLNPRVNYIFVRFRPADISSVLKIMEQAWMKVAPHLPFTYNFLDEEFDRLYTDVENLGAIIEYFTIIAGLIAFLGLFALSSFAAEKRTKEIGIRKLLGSSIGNILFLLNKDFVKLILLANICVWPIAWIIMRRWLLNFPYHVGLSWIIFILSGLAALFFTMIAVSYQTIRAACASPVKSLRYE